MSVNQDMVVRDKGNCQRPQLYKADLSLQGGNGVRSAGRVHICHTVTVTAYSAALLSAQRSTLTQLPIVCMLQLNFQLGCMARPSSYHI